MVLSALALVACNPLNTTTATLDPTSVKVSSALFSIPSSLSGAAPAGTTAGSSRSLLSDALVNQTVESYYGYTRAQILIGSLVADFVKTFVVAIEAFKVNGQSIIGQSISYDGIVSQPGSLNPVVWTSLGDGRYKFEQYKKAAVDATPEKVFVLNLAYRLEGLETVVAGTMVIDVSKTDWSTPPAGEKAPDWLKVSFDSAKGGKTWMSLELQGYRSFKDLGVDGTQNTIIELTRDSQGTVTAVSNSMVKNSRHFVWNGYTQDTNGAEVLNTSSTGETRFYVFQGMATPENKATVSMAMAVDNYDPAKLYTDYAIGAVVQKFIRDRIVNNYDFDGKSDGAGDEGTEIMNMLNQLPDVALTNASSPAEILAALKATPDGYRTDGVIDFLIGIMSVENPAYFAQNAYQSNGATTPLGFHTPADLNDLVPITETSVEGLNITF